MRKRPDYGDATPEDVARALMTEHQKKARFRQSGPDTSAASQPDSEQPAASEPECPTGKAPSHSERVEEES